MRQIPVDECPAGPWLDAAVAEKYTGYRTKFYNKVPYIMHPLLDVQLDAVLPYSKHIELAWGLVEESDLLVDNFLTKNEDGKYIVCSKYAGFGEWPEYYEGADENVALAITRAFLKAKGITGIEMPDEDLPPAEE